MYKYLTIVACLSCLSLLACAQKSTAGYEGAWVGHLPDRHSFNFTVTLEELTPKNYQLLIANTQTLLDKQVKSTSKDHLKFNIDDQLRLDFYSTAKGQELRGFIKSGRYFYHLTLQRTGPRKFQGTWNPFMLNDSLISNDILVYFEKINATELHAYPFFGDQRFRGTRASGFKRKDDKLFFRDDNTGFRFCATFFEDRIGVEIFLLDALITQTDLIHADDWEYKTDPLEQNQTTQRPPDLKDGWATNHLKDVGLKEAELRRLIDSVHTKALVNTHSVLITKREQLVFETYFDGFNAVIPHDLRSASKSISSAMIGIAIDDGIIKGVEEKLYDFIPEVYQYTKDEDKAKIRIKDLLTMSSGLDVNNLASEDYYQDSRRSDSWLKTVLEAPMVKEPGTYADYGSANPFLLGVCLRECLEKPLEVYMDEKLFAPLGIRNYINQTDDTELHPYFGGGMLITSRDLLKFGQLYLNKGKWKGKQIVSESWVEESFQKHMQLQDVRDKNEYGYQWWHDSYKVKEIEIKTIEARGAGGQFIFVIPQLESVVVITSGNFRNGKGNQARTILQEYILPAFVY